VAEQPAAGPRLIALFGSGETSPVMTSVHQDLIARAGAPQRGVLLDTPFGFQENADEIADRAIAYFRDHVGCEITLASFRHSGQSSTAEFEHFLTALGDATYVFAGPGSPTYALRHWRHPAVRDRLAEKITRGGCVAFASAAAISLGAYALPVYEIYKVGEDPHWTEGLDVLGAVGVHCAVVPHYNNREGGTHDTRYCYMGEARLRVLESMLPDDLLILGIDEYTACIIDVDAASVTVRGRGGVTVRRHGIERRWQRTSFPLRELREVQGAPAGIAVPAPARHASSEVGTVPARARGEDKVREDLARLVDVLLRLRSEARREQRFQDADRLRTILAQCGVEVQDTPSGTAWSLPRA
jgi:cyanophycinase-like exopeptidase